MDRSEILDMMAALQLSGMRAAYDEIVTNGIKRKHSVDQIIAALLKAEIAEKQARSIRYQMGIAKLPLAKELADFVFKDTPINEQLVRDLAGGNFLTDDGVAQAFAERKLGKSHAPQLVLTGEALDAVIALEAGDTAPERVHRQVIDQLREYELSFVHGRLPAAASDSQTGGSREPGSSR